MRTVAPLFLVLLVSLGGCGPSATSPPPSATAIIDSAVAAHGGPVLDRAVMTFRFRGTPFRLTHRGGRFQYRRAVTDSLGRSVVEGLTNEGPYRVVDGDTVALSPDERATVSTAVNSVAYFALLPRPLQDDAVQPTYSGRDTINGVPYHRLRVTFRQDGGGRDWQDIFLYWFRTDTYAMDYLAYAYGLGPTEETGTRFRQADNVRRRGGVRIADYDNYTADSLAPDQMHRYPDLLARDALTLVSQIVLDSVQVRPLPNSS